MDLNNNDAAVCTDSVNAQPGTTSASEIDLYDELIAFAELSPEEQLRLAGRQEQASAETENTSAEEAEEHQFAEPVLTHAPVEPVEVERWAAELETLSAESGEHTSPETVLIQAPIEIQAPSESVEAETAAAEIETPSTEEAGEQTSPEPVLTHAQIEAVESDTTVFTSASASGAEVSKAYVEPGGVRASPGEGPRPSGPLSGFNLPPNLVYTGALSRGVCLACGAESAADDLFCITCGVFIDEIESTLPVNPTCSDCKERIAPDEIFCPWCGSVLSA